MAETLHDSAAADRQPGIGRLDLAVAVACLGALAALAVPRQREVSAQTHRTEIEAMASSIRSAASLGHALWRARGGPATLEVERGAVKVRVAMVNGYPAAGDLALLLEEPETMAFVHAGGAWRHRGVGEGNRCGVNYAPPQRPNQPPSVRLEVTDC